jgi:hypothetical protein
MASSLPGQQLGHRNAGDRRVGDQRHHGIAVAAQYHRLDVLDRDLERVGEEGAVAGGVEHARHAEHPFPRKPLDFMAT